MKVAIIGGGAAGFFAAIQVKENYPKASVVIFEKTKTVLAKVKVSGGGRCNLSHATETIKELATAYPRGEHQLRKAFGKFSNVEAMQWFENRGVPLVVQEDGCVFPASQNSQSIIDCLTGEANKFGVSVWKEMKVEQIKLIDNQLQLCIANDPKSYLFDKVIVTTGGSPKSKGLDWLKELNHNIVPPVPSLFTFNISDDPITKLMGVVIEKAIVNIQGTKLKSEGALLITHWGMSGPAVLKLSSFGARVLAEKNYEFKIQVNWVNQSNNELVRSEINKIVSLHPKKMLSSIKPYSLSQRLWTFLLDKSVFPKEKTWNEIGKKGINKIVSVLTNDVYIAKGKTTFKEEFVTAGGVSLDSVNIKTMQSKVVPNLYFAGEVLDIDGITGGYNFQAAWTTGFIAGKLLA